MPSTPVSPRLRAARGVAGAGAATLLAGLVSVALADAISMRATSAPIAQSSVALFDDDNGVALFSKSELQPGRARTGCISVQAASASEGDQVLLAATDVSGSLAPDLTLQIETGTGGHAGDCTGFTGRVVWNGTLTDLAATGDGVPLGWDPGASATRSFRISASSTTSNWVSGRSATATLVWRLVEGIRPTPTPTATTPTGEPTPTATATSTPPATGTTAPTSAGPPPTGTSPAPTSAGSTPAATTTSTTTSTPTPTGSGGPTSSGGPTGPGAPGTGSGGGPAPDVTLRAPSSLARTFRLAYESLFRTLKSPQYPAASLAIAVGFVLVEQWLARRDPKLIEAARTSRETERAFPDRFPPGARGGLR